MSTRQRRTVEVIIDRLVLHGASPGDREQIVSALERELRRLAGESGTQLSTRSGSLADVELVSQPGAKPEEVARNIARSLWQAAAGGSAQRSLVGPSAGPPDPRSLAAPHGPEEGDTP